MKTIMMKKWEANAIHGGLTQTSKMPCRSYSTPTALCVTGFRMSKVSGSICSKCYAQRGFYSMYAASVEPAQHARYEAMLYDPHWVDAMVVSLINDTYFRWFDSGDLPSLEALERIVEVCRRTPACMHWLPTREYSMVKAYIEKHGRDSIPNNLVIRLSAMYPDKPADIPASLQGIRGIATSNVHSRGAAPLGAECGAAKRGGRCESCRDCWDASIPAVSYGEH